LLLGILFEWTLKAAKEFKELSKVRVPRGKKVKKYLHYLSRGPVVFLKEYFSKR